MIQITTPHNGSSNDADPQATDELLLSLVIRDADLCRELVKQPEGRARQDYGIAAMRIGALAMQHAQGRVDAESIRREGDRVVEQLERTLAQHSGLQHERMVGVLGDYFDPESGRFSERVERLIRGDGELERLLQGHLGQDGSTLADTLAEHLGAGSPLMTLLDPEAEDGIAAELTASLEAAVGSHREALLAEFSLDNKGGALARLVAEVDELQKGLGDDVAGVVDKLAKEFSLDRDDSALSRLIVRVERSQASLADEFSLDREGSALSRIRRELIQALDAQKESNAAFQAEVRETLAVLTTRREEAKRSTLHGTVFEDAAFSLIQSIVQPRGDIATPAGNTVGKIARCKKGDAVVALGPEHRAAGTQIVVETKGNQSYTLKSALEEIALARDNREAEVGIFVFAPHAAPDGLEPLARFGRDIVVIWDSEDSATDIRLESAILIARAVATRVHDAGERAAVDLAAMDDAVAAIRKQLDVLDTVENHCKRAIKNNEDALKAAGKIRSAVGDQVSVLEESIEDVRTAIDETDDDA